jgi:ATP/maltotriose-dependent transcriptional regulator MalT
MTVVLTKIKIPYRRKDILRRQRLIDILHNNIDRKLTFISSPAGYGKTTLLTDFAEDVDAVVCWYRIDRDDVDVAPFAVHLVLAFQQQYPEFGKDILPVLQAGGGGLDASGLSVEIVNEMVRKVTDFTLLVLDDYHLVGEKQAIVDLIENILSYLPDQVRIIIASRSVYGIPAASLYVRSDLATLSAEDLRFQPEELKKLVREHYAIDLKEEQVQELADRSDGWIIAILLAIRTLEQGGQPRFLAGGDEMYRFLAEEVVALQPDYLRKFLLHTSILEDFNEESCKAILKIENSQDLIQELEERNLFLTRIETSTGSVDYRYHQLFSEFLEQRFAEIDPVLKINLHERAAEWYSHNGFWEKAIQHKIAAGDRLSAANWMDRSARELFVSGKTSVIADWIRSLTSPVDIRGSAPWLALNWAKVLYERGEYVAGDQFLDIAEKNIQIDQQSYELSSLYVTRGMGKIYQGQPAAALELAQKALVAATEHNAEQYYISQAERLMGLSYRYLGKLATGIEFLRKAELGFRKYSRTENSTEEKDAYHDLAETLTDLGVASYEIGNILDAQKFLEEVIQIRRKQKSNLGGLIIALNNVGYMYYILGRYRQAWNAYEEALSIAQTMRNHRGVVHILNSRGDLLRDLGEWKAAEASYLEARRRAESADNTALFATYFGLSDLERRRGNYHDALYWLREAARIRNQNIESPEYQVGLGQVYLDMGQLEMAGQAFRDAANHLETSNQPSENLSLAYFLYGRVCFETGNLEDALRYLQSALATAARLGYDQFLVVAAKTSQQFLAYANSNIEHSQLASIVNRSQTLPDFKSLVHAKVEAKKKLQLKLQIKGFGTSTVFKDGEMITVSDWKSTNARGLFFFIIDRGGIRKDEIAIDLWPDFPQAKATSNFHSTLWRVRKALGNKDAIVYDQEKYRLHPDVDYEYEVHDFEAAISAAEDPNQLSDQRMRLLQKAINLYNGEFLPDIPGSWVDLRREALHHTYVRALFTLGESLQQQGKYADAMKYYDRIIAVDPYRDDIQLEIIKCLASSGKSSAAKAQFLNYRDFLWRELKTLPQEDLQAYYDTL